MKKIILSIALLASSFIGAQTVVFSEDFEGDDTSNWTFIDSDNDTYNWSFDYSFDEDGSFNLIKVLRSASYISGTTENPGPGSLTPDNWAITKKIDLTAASGTIMLKWKALGATEYFQGDKYGVYVATANDIASLEASSTNLVETNQDMDVLTDRSLDISAFAGQEIYIGFRHFESTNLDYIVIDDVEVSYGATAGVNDVLKNEVAVNYNKLTNSLSITTNALTVSSVKIYNILGKLVQENKVNASKASVLVKGMAKGMYIVKIETPKGAVSKKIVF